MSDVNSFVAGIAWPEPVRQPRPMTYSPITPEERVQRQKHVNDLMLLIHLAKLDDYIRAERIPPDGWIHLTDGDIDFEGLIGGGLIRLTHKPYQPRGNWHDQFPQFSFELTIWGYYVYRNPGQYVRPENNP